jgi:hypothetical protein
MVGKYIAYSLDDRVGKQRHRRTQKYVCTRAEVVSAVHTHCGCANFLQHVAYLTSAVLRYVLMLDTTDQDIYSVGDQ